MHSQKESNTFNVNTLPKIESKALVDEAEDNTIKESAKEDLNKNTLETEFSKITKDKNNRMTMVAEYENIEKMLGSQGVSDKAVLSILKTLKGTK